VSRSLTAEFSSVPNASKTLRGRGEIHTFTGLVKCAECGQSFNYHKSHKGTGQYRCGGKKRDKDPGEALKRYHEQLGGNGQEEKIKRLEIELAKSEYSLAEKREIHSKALRKELEGDENAEAHGKIAEELTIELRDLLNLKSRLESEIAPFFCVDRKMRLKS
jgi:hypothetical protein